MAEKTFEEALAEWPHTKPLKDGGVHVFGRYEQPGLSKSLTTLVLFILCLLFFGPLLLAGSVWGIFAPILFLLAYPFIIRPWLVKTSGNEVDVKIYRDRLEVRESDSNNYSHSYRYRSYDRNMPINFQVEPHQKGLEEHDREVRMRRQQDRTYREAFEVVMQYGEKRVPLAEFPATDVEKAKSLVFRLQNVCAGLDALAKMGQEQAAAGQEAAGDFGPAPKVR